MPKSQGPLLRRHYPASTLIRPCPTPVMVVAFRNVEDATLANDESPPITRTTFPTCRAHYPGGSSGCACRLLPALVGAFPKWQEGRHPHCHFRGLHRLHSVTARRIAQPPKVTFVTRLRPSQLPDQAARQLPDLSTIIRVESSSTGVSRPRGALPDLDIHVVGGGAAVAQCSRGQRELASAAPAMTDRASGRPSHCPQRG